MTHILFVCGKARRRSPTAAEIANRIDGVTADFAGLSADADERITGEHVVSADVIAVMERRQLARLKRIVTLPANARVVCLGIPDRYEYMDVDLVNLLVPKIKALARR